MNQSFTTEISDEELLNLLKQERSFERGFGLLLAKYQERLYHHIRRMVVSHEDTDDVLQNTFIKVYKNIAKFKANSKLYTWLYRIATNESLTFLDKRKRNRTNSIDNEESGVANQLTAEAYFDGDEVQRKLQLALETLPDKQKLVFNMRYFEEMSYKDISAVLETSIGALKASYHHAVKKIEAYFKNID